MKQTITIMAVFMVALLLVSGFIVAGSMQQAQQLASRASQLGEIKIRLSEQTTLNEELQQNVDALSASLTAVRTERDELNLRLKDALLSVEEANGAISQQVTDMETAQTSFTQEKVELAASLSEQQTLSDALAVQLEEMTAERDGLAARVSDLETQLSDKAGEASAAALESNARAQENAALIKSMNAEGTAFRALLGLWSRVQAGKAEEAALTTALNAFARDYPNSEFSLPEVIRPTATATPTLTPTITPSPTPTAIPTPAKTVKPSPLPLRTFTPVVTVTPENRFSTAIQRTSPQKMQVSKATAKPISMRLGGGFAYTSRESHLKLAIPHKKRYTGKRRIRIKRYDRRTQWIKC